jgi:hypothetical protein
MNKELLIQTILGECESIISSVENMQEEIDFDSMSGFAIDDMRYLAEELPNYINEKELLNDISIQLYQEVKYSFESLEDDYESILTDVVKEQMEFIRSSVNIIRECVNII